MTYWIISFIFGSGLALVLVLTYCIYNLIRFAVYKYFGGKKSIREYFKNI